MDTFFCSNCGRDWATNYCPECHQTIGPRKSPPPLPPTSVKPPVPTVPSSPPPLPVQTKKSPVPRAVIFAGVLVLLIAGFFGYRTVQFVHYVRTHPHLAQPGELEFREANRQIITGRSDEPQPAGHGPGGSDVNVAFGNNPEAVALAKSYSKNLKVLRDTFISQGHETALGMLEGECTTYCQLNDDSCVFLVHLRDLRRFTAEAKTTICELAWMNAQSVLKAGSHSPPKTVVVGVKGLMLYESILIGDYTPDPEPHFGGVKTRGSGLKDMKLFYPFFAPKTEASSLPTMPASTNAPNAP